jgi:hypothetical protein
VRCASAKAVAHLENLADRAVAVTAQGKGRPRPSSPLLGTRVVALTIRAGIGLVRHPQKDGKKQRQDIVEK